MKGYDEPHNTLESRYFIMTQFSNFNLDEQLLWSLSQMNYTTPTPIQAQSIPHALEGKDIMGSAQTGTGKTAAFAIPLVQHLINNSNSCGLILVPTRELGKQIITAIHEMLKAHKNIKTAFIIGGEPMGKQLAQIKKNPRLIVGTPGRINDHLERRSLKLKDVDFLVLDETDRMLDMGFSVQLDRIFTYMQPERQTLMFSATLPKDILQLSKKYLNDPVRVAVGEASKAATNIQQEITFIAEDKKYEKLISELYEREGSAIIFVKTKFATERLAKKLCAADLKSAAIHGDMKQSKRERMIQDLRQNKYRILVATDVVARGLDVPHLAHVINYDLPQVPEDYIHRIGRTARAGKSGFALSLVSPKDEFDWRDIEKLLEKETLIFNGEPSKKAGSGKPSGGRRRSFGSAKPSFGGGARRKSEGSSRSGSGSRRSASAGASAGRSRSEGRPEGKKRFADGSRKTDFSSKRNERTGASRSRSEGRPEGKKLDFSGKRSEGVKSFGSSKKESTGKRSEGAKSFGSSKRESTSNKSRSDVKEKSFSKTRVTVKKTPKRTVTPSPEGRGLKRRAEHA